jgi:hypothetical protein
MIPIAGLVLAFVVTIVGLLLFVFAKNPSGKAIEVGRMMFWVGLLAFLLTVGPLLLFLRR